MNPKIAILLSLLATAALLGAAPAHAEPTESSTEDGSGGPEPARAGTPCYFVDYSTVPPTVYEVPC